MERKNYLLEELSKDEKNYLKSAIKKAFLDFLKEIKQKNKFSTYSIEDEYIKTQLPMIVDKYFVDEEIELWDDNKKYSLEQKNFCVEKLDEIALELGVKEILRTLTFNEKLVFFLLEVKRYYIYEIAYLLNVTPKTVYNRNQSAKRKNWKGEEK